MGWMGHSLPAECSLCITLQEDRCYPHMKCITLQEDRCYPHMKCRVSEMVPYKWLAHQKTGQWGVE